MPFKLKLFVSKRSTIFVVFALLVVVYSGVMFGPKFHGSVFEQELPSLQELQEESNPVSWKSCGGRFVNDSDSKPRKQHNKTHRTATAKLLSVTSLDVRVKNLLQKLHYDLPLSCQSRPIGEQKELGAKFATFLEALTNYTVFHKAERENHRARRLLWFCEGSCGGLADRMRGITYALMLAIFSQRVLHVDWGHRTLSERAFLEPNLIDWHLMKDEQKAYSKDHRKTKFRSQMVLTKTGADATPKIVKKLLESLNKKSVKWVAVNSNMNPSTLANDSKIVAFKWVKEGMSALHLDKLSVHDLDIYLIGLAFRYLFRFSPYLMQEVEAARRVLGLQGLSYVGLHVRTGFVGAQEYERYHPKLFKKPWQWKDSVACAHRYTNQQFPNGAPIFIATDSQQVKVMVWPGYSGEIRCLNNSVLHLDKLSQVHHRTVEQMKEGFLSVWVELILLAESHSLVRGDSGYAHLAQSLCLMPRKRTIDAITCFSV